MKKLLEKEIGITLIALMITIIVLLILAGVTIQTLTGDNGLLQKAEYAKEENEEAKELELIKLAYLEYETTRFTSTNLDVATYFKNSLEKTYGTDSINIIKDKNNEEYYYIVIKKTNRIYKININNKNIQITNRLPGQYRFIKIEITKVKEYGIQMSEFNFYDENNNRFQYPSETLISSNAKGDNNAEEIDKLIDNNVNTKFCNCHLDNEKLSSGKCTVIMDFGTNNYIDINNYMYYAYYTANDTIGRDPISWIISGSNNSSEWITLDVQNNQEITNSRGTKTQTWTINN